MPTRVLKMSGFFLINTFFKQYPNVSNTRKLICFSLQNLTKNIHNHTTTLANTSKILQFRAMKLAEHNNIE